MSFNEMPTNETISPKTSKNVAIRNPGKLQTMKLCLIVEKSMIKDYESLIMKLVNATTNPTLNLTTTTRYRFRQLDLNADYDQAVKYAQHYCFDEYFLGNLALEQIDQLSKFEFEILSSTEIQQLTQQDGTFEMNVVQDQQLAQQARTFGYIKSYLKHLLRSRSGWISGLNDNFLNFRLPRPVFDPEEAWSMMKDLSNENDKVRMLVQCCRTQMEQSGANVHNWCLSFNGGKDCTVLLHTLATLYWATQAKTFPSSDQQQGKINLLLLRNVGTNNAASGELFPEQNQYIERVKSYYGCNMVIYKDKDFKSALGQVHHQESFRTIFMGCRRTDFRPELANTMTMVQKTDPGWPEFIRVNPLLDWSYDDVWLFLLKLMVPYCSLYDYGYTSIDRIDNTEPNPTLKRSANLNCPESVPESSTGPKGVIKSSNGQESQNLSMSKIPESMQESISKLTEIYLPAYLLERDDTERSSRNESSSTTKT